MVDYTHEYSNFPSEVIEKHNFKDIDNNVAIIINTIKSLQSQGLYAEASKIISDNIAILKPYVIDSSVINELVEHIRNAEICSLATRQHIHTDETEPYACLDGDIWMGGE